MAATHILCIGHEAEDNGNQEHDDRLDQRYPRHRQCGDFSTQQDVQPDPAQDKDGRAEQRDQVQTDTHPPDQVAAEQVSEELSHGQIYGGLLVINPFKDFGTDLRDSD